MHASCRRASATGHHGCGYVSCQCGAGCDHYSVCIHCFVGGHSHGRRNWHAGVQHVQASYIHAYGVKAMHTVVLRSNKRYTNTYKCVVLIALESKGNVCDVICLLSLLHWKHNTKYLNMVQRSSAWYIVCKGKI
ncbi:ORF62L [Turbot reddish body iridovirus]|uniref:ORF62L n=1 Tax=Turbot reddish body iridovirus TaxID=273651 RepID=E2CU07_ISKNV|nr:ORF62L [Turbot reddish body iridovirus]